MGNADWFRRALGGEPAPPTQLPIAPPAYPGYQRPLPPTTPEYQGTAAEQLWHGRQTGNVPIQDAIRQHRGTVAQEAMSACPSCGSPDGFTAVMPAAGEVASNAFVNQKMLDRSMPRTGHCFYCGYRGPTRGAPVDGIGFKGIPTEGETRAAHGLSLADQTTRNGNQMGIDHSLVGMNAAG
jgi:hypothetical protein